MSTYVAGNTITIWVTLVSGGLPITDAVDADFTESIDHEATNGTLTAATVSTWQHRSNGRYYATISNSVAGKYSGTITYDGTPVQVFAWEADVITAAQADPAQALADTVTAVDAISERLTDARAAKLDRIGSNAEVVAAGTLEDGDKLEIRRGDSYLAADGNAKQWSYGGSTIASATLTLRTFAGTQALQVPVTQAGSILSADITSDETTALLKGTPIYRYEIVATLSGGGVSTLISGVVWVKD